MSAASDMSIDILLRHDSMPVLMYWATTVKNAKEKIRLKHGHVWESKQRLPASSVSVEETLKAALSLCEQRKSLPGPDRSSIHRGDFPMTDKVIDEYLSILRKESMDLGAHKPASTSTGNKVPCAASVVMGSSASASRGTAAAASNKSSSFRKRSYSSARSDDAAAKISKGGKGGRVAAFHSRQSGSARTVRNRSSGRSHFTSSTNGRSEWRAEKAIDGTKKSSFISSSDLVGGAVATLNSTVDDHPKVIANDDNEVSVPELDEENHEDAWNVQVAEVVMGPRCEKPLDISVPRDGSSSEVGDEIGVETDLDNLESLVLGIGFQFGASNSFDGIQDDFSTNCRFFADTAHENEFPEEHSLYMDDDCEPDDGEMFHRPSKRVRTASLESLIALLG